MHLENEMNVFYTLNKCLIVTGLIIAACESRTVLPAINGYAKLTNGIYNGHSLMLKAQSENGFKSSNGSLNGVHTNGNGVYVDGSC